MKTETRPLSRIIPYENNPRNNDGAVDAVAESIRQCGYIAPIIVDEDGVILAGHTRHRALKKLGYDEAEVIIKAGLTEEQKRKYRLLDNKTAELAEWDIELLKEELDGLDFEGFDFDFDVSEPDESDISNKYVDSVPGALRQKFIVPPFSIVDARAGDWQKRKNAWNQILRSQDGRGDDLLGSKKLMESIGRTSLPGTSIFDPVLCEVLLHWFSPRGGKILDPFAGGSVRGIVSSFLGRRYFGNDLRQEQIDENLAQAGVITDPQDFFGDQRVQPVWTVGDSQKIDEIIAEDEFDMLLTCPPYADLEVYSDDPADISNMDYEDFLAAYRNILAKSVAKLKENAFICVVVGEVRDKNGHLRNFIGDTIDAVEAAGAKYYNEIVLITMAFTAAFRAGHLFTNSRKVVNSHQKALVFMKSNGDDAALKEYIRAFEQERTVMPMKKSILVFLRGNAKLAKADIQNYEFDLF